MIASPQVDRWPMISWSAQNLHQLQLVHLDSWLLAATRAADGGPLGRSVWTGLGTDGLVGLAWNWAQVQPGVLALADPLAVQSNLRLLGSDGVPLGRSAMALVHGRLVNGLAWQVEALKWSKRPRSRRIEAVQVLGHAGASPS